MNKEYKNPLVLQRADPWCYKHSDGYYYFTASVPAYDRIELRRAKTLNGLADGEVKTIWTKHESGPMSYNIWAPEIHFICGKWYIYFAAARADEHFAHRCYVLECEDEDPMTGKWIEKGQVDTGWEDFSLDMTSFIHKNEQYVVWAQRDRAIPGNSNLYIAKAKNPWTLETKAVMISIPEYDWEKVKFFVNEGPAVLCRNGKIFVTYSASATDHNYCIGLLWIDENADLLDANNWHKSEKPVFKTCEENGQYGPGHSSFTTDEDKDILVYHCRSYKEIEGDPLYDPNRHTRAIAFGYDEEGFPMFGKPPKDNN
ncbi:MAG: family 43 glycosylhydrolase [Clostridia bacterium]|nr:family 43 glycosylhydrolase [Clostridia bacterium]